MLLVREKRPIEVSELAMEYTEDRDVMLKRLSRIRENMNYHKNEKLKMKWLEYGDYRQFGLRGIINAMEREIKELKAAIANSGPDLVKGEIVDVSNTLDFLWDCMTYGGRQA